MRKFIVPAFFIIIGLVVLVTAMKPTFTTAKVSPSDGHATVTIPETAVQVAEGVFDLGLGVDVDGTPVRGMMFIKNKKEHAKPGTECGNGICEPGENAKKCPADCAGGEEPPPEESKCFAFIARGARWRTTEPYVLDTTNNDGISSSSVASTVSTSLEAWDTEVAFDIFGTRNTSASVDGADTSSPDNKNEIFFADTGGSIGTTIVWYTLGSPRSRRIVEYDMVLNHIDYNFGDTGPTSETELGNTSITDLQAVVTHEGGHGGGMGHPDDSCTEETMYRFYGAGETKQRTLNTGDIAGINELY